MKKINFVVAVLALSLMYSCGGGGSTESTADSIEETAEGVTEGAEEAVADGADAVERAAEEVTEAASEVPDSLEAIGNDGQTYTDAEGRLVYNLAEVQPEFIGGTDALNKYLSKNIKYPAEAKRAKNEGRVIVQFVVAEDGSIVDTEVAKAAEDASLNEEAMRVINEMPNWKPGVQGGKPVNVKYTLPVTFKLQ